MSSFFFDLTLEEASDSIEISLDKIGGGGGDLDCGDCVFGDCVFGDCVFGDRALGDLSLSRAPGEVAAFGVTLVDLGLKSKIQIT